MYIWHEAIASRGPPEITSCLMTHINRYIPKECIELVMYSDSTGAQNRNIKTSVLLSQLLEKHDHLHKITQQFYRTGHSYNVCDAKFSIIEKSRKKTAEIYVPSQWTELIVNAKTTHPKFIVNELNAKHFMSSDQLISKLCTNRKKTTNNQLMNWFTFRKISLIKGQPLKLHFETYDDIKLKYDESLEFPPDSTKVISVVKKGFNNEEFIGFQLPLLYPHGRPIATAKKDLMELLEFIPQNFHKFYAALDHAEMDPDDVIVVSDGEDDNSEQ